MVSKNIRKRNIEQAIANEKIEGLKVSSSAKEIAGNYIAGEISAKEAAKQIRMRYRNH